MDLSKKLNMLAGETVIDSDSELAGVSIYSNNQKKSKNETDNEEEFFDFNPLSIDSYLSESGYSGNKKKSKKKKKQNKIYEDFFKDINISETTRAGKEIEKISQNTRRMFEQSEISSAEEFDSFMNNEELFSLEEDMEMRNNLVSLGRKYARDSATSKESSEINKAYADADKKLKSLYEELDRDKMNLQKDIDRMRVPGRGSGKSLADLISVKNSMQSTQLSIVKELNSVRKTIFELRAKEAARKEAENAGSSDITPNTLQNIFSSARSNLVNSLGGYSGISGASDDSSDSYSNSFVVDDMDDEEIQKRYFKNSDPSNSSDDGSKFLEYENRGVEYVLLIDEDDVVQGIIAEDKDGSIIPDYPLPNNIESLAFEIDHTAKTASDSMHRNYRIRIVD